MTEPIQIRGLETHPFNGDHDAFYCLTCSRPRALHLNDGFMPKHTPSSISKYPKSRYRGGHPFFSKATMTIVNPIKHPPSYAQIRKELAKLERDE